MMARAITDIYNTDNYAQWLIKFTKFTVAKVDY